MIKSLFFSQGAHKKIIFSLKVVNINFWSVYFTFNDIFFYTFQKEVYFIIDISFIIVLSIAYDSGIQERSSYR